MQDLVLKVKIVIAIARTINNASLVVLNATDKYKIMNNESMDRRSFSTLSIMSKRNNPNNNDENYSNQVSKMIESIHDKHFNIFIEVLAPSTFTPNNILIGKKIKDCIKLAEKRKKSNCCIY